MKLQPHKIWLNNKHNKHPLSGYFYQKFLFNNSIFYINNPTIDTSSLQQELLQGADPNSKYESSHRIYRTIANLPRLR